MYVIYEYTYVQLHVHVHVYVYVHSFCLCCRFSCRASSKPYKRPQMVRLSRLSVDELREQVACFEHGKVKRQGRGVYSIL